MSAATFYQGCDGNVDTRDTATLAKRLQEYENENWVCEVKSDGMFATVFVWEGKPRFFSRNGLERTNDLNRCQLPDGLIVAAELGASSRAATLEAKKLGYTRCPVYRLIRSPSEVLGTDDMSVLDGISMDEVEQRKCLEELWERFDIDTDRFPLIPRWKGSHWMHYCEILLEGGEGIIIKSVNPSNDTTYKVGTRSPLWLKVKKTVELDMVVMGRELSEAYGGGYAKNIACGMYKDGVLVERCTVGNMSDYWRKEFGQNIKNRIGTVVKIGANELFDSGKLRHPFLLEVRDDKMPEECVW